MEAKQPKYILPVLIISQFAGTSLWFAGNAIMPQIQQQFNLTNEFIGYITIAVQLGFILGTLVFALTMMTDRINSSLLFFVCALLGALSNVTALWISDNSTLLLLSRLMTGFFLAGIYPVGMKIASDWYAGGLGKALGLLVGALVFGTAFPHLIKGSGAHIDWQTVIIAVSVFAAVGGLMILLFIKEGPFKRKGSKFNIAAVSKIFSDRNLKAAAFGYFGHMWELYTLWAFLPLIFAYYATQNIVPMNASLFAFYIIAIGGVGCIVGGFLSKKFGSKKVAATALIISGMYCIVSPLLFETSFTFFILHFALWGLTVTADSPQFSTLVAANAKAEYKGTALTLITSIGFAITVVSIQFLNFLWNNTSLDHQYLLWTLAPGPILGVLALRLSDSKNVPRKA
jgi:MFS family permease